MATVFLSDDLSAREGEREPQLRLTTKAGMGGTPGYTAPDTRTPLPLASNSCLCWPVQSYFLGASVPKNIALSQYQVFCKLEISHEQSCMNLYEHIRWLAMRTPMQNVPTRQEILLCARNGPGNATACSDKVDIYSCVLIANRMKWICRTCVATRFFQLVPFVLADSYNIY